MRVVCSAVFLLSWVCPAADRELAEWVLRLGGTVTLAANAPPVTTLAGLPPGDVRLHGVSLVGTLVEPPELARLAAVPHLKELFLPGPMWNPGAGSQLDANEAFKDLAGLTQLEKLHFSVHFLTNVNVQDKGLAHLAPLTGIKELRLAQTRIKGASLAPFVNLEYLDLSYTPFNDEGARSLAGMQRLKKLHLRDTFVTDEGLKNLAGLAELTELDLYGLRLTDAGLAHLAGLKRLRRLNLLGASITDAGIEHLREMAELEELNLYRSQITNAALDRLQSLKRLRSLDLRYTRASAGGVAALRAALPHCQVEFIDATARGAEKDVPAPAGRGDKAIAAWIESMGGRAVLREGKLVEASLAATRLGDAQVQHLTALAHLETLDLSTTEVGDLGLKHVAALGNLRELHLKQTMVSDAGLAHLAPLGRLRTLSLANTLVRGAGLERLPNLVELNLSGAALNDAGLRQVAALSKLERLSLSYSDVTGEGLAALRGMNSLKWLDLTATDVGDAGLLHLPRNLEGLSLSYGRFSAKALAALEALPNLAELELVRTRTNDEALAVIGKLQKLRRLNLDYTAVTGDGLAHLAGLPLVELRLDSANITDAAIERLKIPTLKTLNLYHTLVTEAGYETLKAALPGCNVIWDRESGLPTRRGS